MNKYLSRTAIAAVVVAFGSEAMATEWNVSVWGKRRAFTEHIEKLAELVSEKTGGEFTMNISYGGLSKNRENLDGISIGVSLMRSIWCDDCDVIFTSLSIIWTLCRRMKSNVSFTYRKYGVNTIFDFDRLDRSFDNKLICFVCTLRPF